MCIQLHLIMDGWMNGRIRECPPLAQEPFPGRERRGPTRLEDNTDEVYGLSVAHGRHVPLDENLGRLLVGGRSYNITFQYLISYHIDSYHVRSSQM